MVEERIAAGGDAANLASLIVESLVDLILLVPEKEQAGLMAHTIAALGDLFLQKSGADGGGSGDPTSHGKATGRSGDEASGGNDHPGSGEKP